MPELPKRIIGPSERLALGADIVKTVGTKALGPKSKGRTPQLTSLDGGLARNLAGPTVRLAMADGQAERNGTLEPPTVRLAHKVNGQGDRTLKEGGTIHDPTLPALLVSYVYLEPFLANKHRYAYRDWVMDSGAFSAHNSGEEIILEDYTECCKRLLSEDNTLTEVFALDVIGDWKASIKNVEKMWKLGVEAIPTFHYGSPWEVLKGLAKDYPKVAIGGCVGKRDKDKFASQCFGRVWPKKLHGFGFGSEKSLMMLPWHSVDATNWEIGPCKYGRWASFGAIGSANISVRGSNQNLRAEVEWYLDLERKARQRWKKEMAQLMELDGPTIQLGYNPGPINTYKGLKKDSPTVRLAPSREGGGYRTTGERTCS